MSVRLWLPWMKPRQFVQSTIACVLLLIAAFLGMVVFGLDRDVTVLAFVSLAAIFFVVRWANGVNTTLSEMRDETKEAQAMIVLHSWAGIGLVPWSSWAIPAREMLEILNEVRFGERQSVVELGSGISTIFLAAAMAELDRGHVISVEDDQWWAEEVQEMLRQKGLQDRVTVLWRPLTEVTVLNRTMRWYGLSDTDIEGDIDLLLVDGPKGPSGALARLPAVPLLESKFADDVVIFLDDAQRPDERRILRIWKRQFGVEICPTGRDSRVMRLKTSRNH